MLWIIFRFISPVFSPWRKGGVRAGLAGSSGFRSKNNFLPVRMATNQIVITALAKRTGIGVGHQTINEPTRFSPPGTADRGIGQGRGQFGQKAIAPVVIIRIGCQIPGFGFGRIQTGATRPRFFGKVWRIHNRFKWFMGGDIAQI